MKAIDVAINDTELHLETEQITLRETLLKIKILEEQLEMLKTVKENYKDEE